MELTQKAFDLADKYRNPVLIMGDGLIGQMMEPVEHARLPARSHPAGKDLGGHRLEARLRP